MHQFDSIVAGALDVAQSTALQRKNSQLEPVHLLWGLLTHPSSFVSRKLKTQKKEVESLLDKLPTSSKMNMEDLRPSGKFSEWITNASTHAIQGGRQEIAERDLIRFLPQMFPELSINYEDFKEGAEEEELPSFLINLNELAQAGKLDPVIGRTKEIRAVMEILGRRSKNNPVLVGNAGVGKTAIVEGLAEAIVKGDVPDVLQGKTVLSLDLGALMAGTKFRGEFEERIQKLLKYVKERAGEIILFIDELHQLVGAGRTDGAMDAANLLKPALARGDLHCVGATTPQEYQKYILGDSALDRRFRPVMVLEPSKEDAFEILMGVRPKMEIHHGIKISDEAIYQAVLLSDQYITDKFLPDKAIDLIDEASSALKLSAEAMPAKLAELEAEIRSKKILAQMEKHNDHLKTELERMEKEFSTGKALWEKEVFNLKRSSELKNQKDRLNFELEQAKRKQDYETASRIMYSQLPQLEKELTTLNEQWILNPKDIALVISRHTGIPVEKILKSRQDHILALEGELKKRVFGQDKSLHEIAETLIAAHAGLSDERRPLGSFLLKGPSGGGKTETAKALAQFIFDNENNIVRLDMSEFSEKHSVAKLIGAPAGYVGYDDGGVLTEAVRRKPYAVILFDEIEKAHHDFSDILLQILDDGRLTDNKGRTINFKNTIILMTTNSKHIEEDFKPEVLGRIDSILSYNSLDSSIMKSLIAKQVALLNERLKMKQVSVALAPKLEEELSKRGYDERYGARPLNALFQKLVVRPLSHKLLGDHLGEGGYLLDFESETQNLTIKKA